MAFKTLLVIAISTARFIYPDVPILPGADPGAAPTEVKAVSKSMTMNLTTDKRTDGIPSVRVDVPKGLGVGEFVKLIVHEPKPADAAKTAKQPAKFISKTYWGNGRQILDGQPKVEEVTQTTDEAPGCPPGGSYAFWPIGYYGEKVPGPDSKTEGKYTLTSNFCGGTTFEIASDQSYLEPISLIGLTNKLDPSKSIKIRWTKVPRARAYVVTAFGGNDKESITWTSGSDPAVALTLNSVPITDEQMQTYLKNGVVMKPDTTVCNIPAGVFNGANMAVVTVMAIGADKVQTGTDMDTHVLVRSVASIPLTLEKPAPAAAADSKSSK